jgi:hypothetical protein
VKHPPLPLKRPPHPLLIACLPHTRAGLVVDYDHFLVFTQEQNALTVVALWYSSSMFFMAMGHVT